MNRPLSLSSFLLLLLTFGLWSCTDSEQKPEMDPAFGEFISAYTSGVISSRDAVLIQLANPYKGELRSSEALPSNLLTFKPKLEGQLFWLDRQNLKFIPASPMPAGQIYNARFQLSQLVETPSRLEEFRFQFQIIEQGLSVFTDGLEIEDLSDLSRMKLRGLLAFSDQIELETISKAFKAEQNGKELKVIIQHSIDRKFEFIIDDIDRGENRSQLVLSWNISLNPESIQGSETYDIPSLSDFEVTKVQVENGADPFVKVSFSDPILENSVDGMVSIEDVTDLKYKVESNQIFIYPGSRLQGARLLTIAAEIKNLAGKPMGKEYSESLLFELEKPNVRIVGNKNIIPSQEEGLLFPFEAVSLKGVDIFITKVFNNNILQYLQSNDDYNDHYYLNRVGRHIYRKHIDLRKANVSNPYTWQRYHIDLSEIIKADPGAYYEVDIRFSQSDALYTCDETDANKQSLQEIREGWISDGEYFVDDYWNHYEYNWEEYENPCNAAYYGPYKNRARKMVMATNLGLTAKMGGDDKLFVAVTDLKTAESVAGATIKVYDFQQQLIKETQTNSDGFAEVSCDREPFVVLASSTEQGKTYLKVNEGNALSLSKFEVSGGRVQEGLKGFIYGERGVWRPGDSLYLSFILEDEKKVLPANHPVKMLMRNPMGQLVASQIKTSSVDGFYDFRTATDTEAPTGEYQMQVSVGNRVYSKMIRIETVKPNRLKIEFDFGETLPGAKELQGKLRAQWLHGAIASKLKADVEMSLRPKSTRFEKFPNYHFDNSIKGDYQSSEMQVFNGTLNTEGSANIKIDMKAYKEGAPGMLSASFNTKVYEPGGNFSVDYHSIDYAPYERFAGMRLPESNLWGNALETEVKHSIELASVKANGKAGDAKSLKVIVYKINRRWWYDRYDGAEYNYLNSSDYAEIISEEIALTKGKGSFPIQIENQHYGRYLIHVEDPETGHSSAQFVYFDWPYWMRANRQDSEASTLLGMSSDKESYAVGEKVKLSFPSPEKGRALVCLENGTRILDNFWVETEAGETQIEIPLSAGMAPNVYAHISLIQPHAQTENDRPIRMFGILPILVEDPDTKLIPLIQTDEVFRPESETSITISEENGKAMTYTLAIVDEGLLSLTRFKTPDPWNHFYAREALGVRTWDMYDQVIGAFTSGMTQALGIGGDDEALDPGKQKAMRFKPMVHFLGPFELSKGKKNSHTIAIPNYVGAVRVMVVAGKNQAYGNAAKEVPVRSPVMVLGTLPRVLGPKESVRLPVNVFANEADVKTVKLSIKTNGPVKVVGKANTTLQFDKPGEGLAYFDLATEIETGVGKITIEAKSGKHRATYEVEIDVMARNPLYTIVKDTVLESGEVWNRSFEYFGLKGSNRAFVEASKLPAINLEARLSFLIGYPHGCIEQITSTVFPQIYLNKMIDLTAEQRIEIDRNVKVVLNQYRNYQISSGALAYWPGSNHSSDWGTNYAGHFMLEAEALGYVIPAGLKSQWLQYQTNASRQWGRGDHKNYAYNQRIQAYRLYTLAKAGKAEFGAMNALKAQGNLDVSARWILAQAYIDAGQKEVASSLIKEAVRTIPSYTELTYSYGSNVRDEGFVLRVLVDLGLKTDAAKLAQGLAKELGSKRWYSTQTVAFSLGALSYYMGGNTKDQGLKLELKHNGKNKAIKTAKSLVQEKLANKEMKTSFQLKNISDQSIYTRLLVSGRPVEGKEKRIAQNLRMEVKYFDNNNKPMDVSKLKMGTDFIAEISIVNPGQRGYYNEMALTQIFPSGWEIMNPRMMGNGNSGNSQATYQDVRDDRVMTYFNIGSGNTNVYRIRLNATYEGRFYLPAVHCSAMYDDDIKAVEPGKWVEVTKQ